MESNAVGWNINALAGLVFYCLLQDTGEGKTITGSVHTSQVSILCNMIVISITFSFMNVLVFVTNQHEL